MVDIGKRKAFGLWLRSMRKDKRLSLREASLALGYSSNGTWVNVECGITALPVEKIDAVATVLDIDLNVMLDKLQECEPDLYQKYTTLEGIFFRKFTSSIMRAGSGLRGQMARHHRPFRGSREVDISKITRTIYYPNLLNQALVDNDAEPHSWIPPWIADKALTDVHRHENR